MSEGIRLKIFTGWQRCPACEQTAELWRYYDESRDAEMLQLKCVLCGHTVTTVSCEFPSDKDSEK